MTSKMKSRSAAHVIVVSQLPPPLHGSSRMTREFLDSLTRNGMTYQLVERRFSRTIDEIGRFSLKKVVSGVLLILRASTAMVTRPGAKIVIFATNRGFSLYCDALIAWVARGLRLERASYIHSAGWMHRAAESRMSKWAVAELTSRVSVVAALSAKLASEFGAKILILPNCTAKANTRPSEKDIDILFLGNLIPEKGAGDAIGVCRELNKTPSEHCRLVIAGPAPTSQDLQHLKNLAEQAGIADRVSFVGAVDDVQRDDLLGRTKVMLFPSTYQFEAQPLVLIEAMSAGVPIVAYGVGGIPDLLSGEAGLCVEPKNLEQLVEAVKTTLGSRMEFSRNALLTWSSNHSRDQYDSNVARLVYEMKSE